MGIPSVVRRFKPRARGPDRGEPALGSELEQLFAQDDVTDAGDAPHLTDGSRVAVVGGGPAGSFFAYFLLQMAEAVGFEPVVDIYEPRRFTHRGPAGRNHCGGIISEFLVQLLAAEGISLPDSIVQRGIDSHVLHIDVGVVLSTVDGGGR